MTDRRRHPGRAVWSPGRRFAVRMTRFVFRSMLNRNGDALSWSACALTLFLLVEAWRLMPQAAGTGPVGQTLYVVPIIGWPDLFLCLLILWGRWIDDAAQKVAEKNPDKIVDKVLPALISRLGIGDVAQPQNVGEYTPDDTMPRRIPPDPDDEV